MSYNVKLNVFEGPLDLLLFFIKRDEINIYDIPIADITREYLTYIGIMESLNLHIAGEFIVMAAMLISIKAQMLLPRQVNQEAEETEDPRTELVAMLLEYKQFKEAAMRLRSLEEYQARYHAVQAHNPTTDFDPDLFLTDVNLLDIGRFFKKLLDKMPRPTYYQIETIKTTISQQSQIIRALFENRHRMRFSEIARRLKNRIEVVVTFLAILEMIRAAEISVSQKTVFGELWLTRKVQEPAHVIANS